MFSSKDSFMWAPIGSSRDVIFQSDFVCILIAGMSFFVFSPNYFFSQNYVFENKICHIVIHKTIQYSLFFYLYFIGFFCPISPAVYFPFCPLTENHIPGQV